MSIRYVGGKPNRVTSYSQRKNIDRWMSTTKPKVALPSFDAALDSIAFVLSTVAVVAFILVCFR